MSNEHTPQVISMTVRELAQAIQAELSAMLELRDELYYKRLGPNNENEDEFYDDENQVETWQVSNRIGGHIAAARRMAAAIERTGEASA